MAPFDFRVLGPLEVRRDGELLDVPAPRQRTLLGFLLLHANQPVSVDELIEEIWGEDPPATARASLRNQIHALRRLLGAETLDRRAAGYVLHVEEGELDLERFERLVAEARRAEPRERAAKLRLALSLWRGTPLVEFPSAPYAQHEIARLEEERLTTLEDRIEAELELGEHAELVAELGSLVERYPLRERLWAQLMLALYRAGRQADAVAAYRRAHRTLVDELGLQPGAGLRDLQRAILAQDAALDGPARGLGPILERAAAILPGDSRLRAESLYEYALGLWRTGEERRAVSTLEAAERLAAAAGETSIEQRARLYRSYLSSWTEGRSPEAVLADARRAQERFEASRDDQGLALALRFQYQVLPMLGRADEAAELARRAAVLASERGDVREEASALMNRAEMLATGTAGVRGAIVECERSVEDVEERRLPPPMALRGLLALGTLYGCAGRFDDARRVLERALALAREYHMFWFLVGTEADLGWLEFQVGDRTKSAQHVRTSYALIESQEDYALRAEIAAALAVVLAWSGELDEACRLGLEARARSSGTVYAEVLWRRALALAAAHEGRGREAVMLADEARARASASDWLTFRGETLEDAARVHRLGGDRDREAAALAAARVLYERKGNVVGVRRVARVGPDGAAPEAG